MLPNSHTHLDYRPDVDGLRAFAVIAVVIYHAFPSALPGGFVGVDIFFVISGFLISGIMFRSLQTGDFSFSDFYARRIERIFPALTLVLLASFAFAWFVLFDDELKQLGNHTLRAVVFLSNFVFWRETGYFDSAAETKPLLHLWSLGIEEQFYVVWPLIVWVLWRLKTWRWQIMAALTAASFSWNVYQAQHDLAHDFYSPLTRFWELSFGALLAYRQFVTSRSPNFAHTVWCETAEVRSVIGAVLLVAAVVCIDADKDFPGVWALLPALGAVLLISGEHKTWVGRTLFGNTWVVWLGTISYPLYLWHWPFFSFARIIKGSEPSAIFSLAAVGAAIVFAWLTLKWLEKPIRFRWQFRYKTGVLIIVMLCVGVLGYLAKETRGFPDRAILKNQRILNLGDIGHDEFHDYHRKHFFTCSDPLIKKDAGEWRGMVRCFQSHSAVPVSMVLLGDSHAEQLFLGLAEHLPNVNVGFYGKGALPLLSKDEFKLIFDHVRQDENINKVIITAAWASRLGEVDKKSSLATDLGQTISYLQSAGKKVYVSDDVMKFSFDPQRCKFQRPLAQSVSCNETREVLEHQRAKYTGDLQELVHLYPEVEWIEISSLMCTDSECSMALNGQLLYRDNNHLNIPGSQFVGAQIVAKHPSLAK